jgi:hypothetical protein
MRDALSPGGIPNWNIKAPKDAAARAVKTVFAVDRG